MRTAPSAFQAPESCRMVKLGARSECQSTDAGIDLGARAVEHAHVHARDVVRVLAHLGDDVLLHDRQRHRPGRIQVDRGDVGGERRRRPVGLADHHHVAPHHLVAVDRLGEGGRNVDHDVALTEREIHRDQAVERGRERAQPLAHRNVERGERLRTDAAGLLETVAGLEAPHRGGDRIVVEIARGLVGGEVVGDGEPLAQQGHVGAFRPRRQLGVRRQRRPAAAHLERGIAQHRRRDARHGALVEGRDRRGRHQGPGRGRLHRGRRLGLEHGRRPRRLGESGAGQHGRDKQREWSEPNRFGHRIVPL